MERKNKDKSGRLGKFDLALKRMVISESRSRRCTMEQLRRRYGLAGKSCTA